MTITIYRSTNDGRSWQRDEAIPGSIVGSYLIAHPDETYDDGYGNLYRLTPPTAETSYP